MPFTIPGVRRVLRSIRAAIDRLGIPTSPSPSTQPPSQSIELEETSFSAEIVQGDTPTNYVSLQLLNGVYCQAVQQVEDVKEYPLVCLLANVSHPLPYNNLATRFTVEKDGSSNEEEPYFTLMNESIQGYVGLTEDQKAFTIVPPYEKSKSCKFQQPGQIIKVIGINKPLYMKVDGKNVIATTSHGESATRFNPVL